MSMDPAVRMRIAQDSIFPLISDFCAVEIRLGPVVRRWAVHRGEIDAVVERAKDSTSLPSGTEWYDTGEDLC